GTPSNLLASDALRDAGLRPFGIIEFLPIGLLLLAVGILYMTLVGRRLLPRHDARSGQPGDELIESFGLQERLFVIRLPQGSLLDGRTLAQSRLGSALGVSVVAVLRPGQPELGPGPEVVLRAGDRLLVQG